MRGHLAFLRREHSRAIRYYRQSLWEPTTAASYRGQAYGIRIAATALIALIRRAEENA